jgi:nucleoside-diphosphate-sugar epimerase
MEHRRSFLDVSELTQLGWPAKIPLRDGIAAAYGDFLEAASYSRTPPR